MGAHAMRSRGVAINRKRNAFPLVFLMDQAEDAARFERIRPLTGTPISVTYRLRFSARDLHLDFSDRRPRQAFAVRYRVARAVKHRGGFDLRRRG